MRSTHFLSVCRFGTAFLEQSSMVPNVRNGVELSMVMAPFQIYLSFQQFFADCMQIWVLRPANSRAQLVIWGLLNVSLAEQHQNLCDLRAACRRAWGQGIAGKEVHSDCPLHGGPCVCADSAAVRERIERSGLRDVIPLIFRIAIQNGNQLFQTERGVRCKFSVSDAVDNTGFRCPIQNGQDEAMR